MPTVIDTSIITDFKVDRVTKNTVRFSEVVSDEQVPVVGTLYVQKSALEVAGFDTEDPNLTITATLTVASIA
jgi:hypothetical protein